MLYKKKTTAKSKSKTNSYTFYGKSKKPYQKQYKNISKRKNIFQTFKTKPDPWLDGTFAIDPLTWEVKHTPAKK